MEKYPELALDAVNNMISGKQETLTMLDAEKGKDVVISDDFKTENVGNLPAIVLEDNGEVLDDLLDIIDVETAPGDKNHNEKTVEKTVELLTNLANSNDKVADEIQKKGGMKKLIDLWENMWKKDIKGNDNPVRKLGKLVGAIGKTPNGYNEIVVGKNFLPKVFFNNF